MMGSNFMLSDGFAALIVKNVVIWINNIWSKEIRTVALKKGSQPLFSPSCLWYVVHVNISGVYLLLQFFSQRTIVQYVLRNLKHKCNLYWDS